MDFINMRKKNKDIKEKVQDVLYPHQEKVHRSTKAKTRTGQKYNHTQKII
jgi:hypothetical protein